MRHIILILLTIISITAPAVTGSAAPDQNAPQQANSAIQLSVEAGFDSYFRGTNWLPVFVTASNEGPNISGHLVVRSTGNVQGSSPTVYTTPIELPTQSRKQITIFATVDQYASGLVVELYHQGLRVTEQSAFINQVQPADVLYAILSDNAFTSVNLDRVRPFAGEAYQAQITIDTLPDQAPGLAALDAILIINADTGNLTDAQRRALQNWVIDGGHLIVSGGANWQRTTAGLDELLPIAVEDTVTVEDLSALEAYLGRLGDVSLYETPTIITTGLPNAGAEVIVSLPPTGDQEETIPLVVRRSYGQGTIDYLALDPTAEPLGSWPNTGELWRTLLTSVNQRASWWAGFGLAAISWANAQEAAEIIPLALPDTSLIFGFLLVYVILMGPLNYLILKRLGRRELAWFTIPTLILAFSILAYITGFGLRGSSAILNRISVVQVWPEADRAKIDGIVGLWSPFRTTYNIRAPEGHAIRPVPVGNVLGAGLNIEVEENVTYTVRDVPVNIGSVRSFVLTGHTETAPALTSDVRLEVTNSRQENTTTFTFWGEVSNPNEFALRDAVLLARGSVRPLGDLEAGEQKSFSIAAASLDSTGNPLHPPPVALARDFLLDVSTYTYFSSQRNRGTTVEDIVPLPDGFMYQPIVTEYDRERRRRYLFMQALIHDLEPTGGRGNNLYLAAWSDKAPTDITLTGAVYTTVDSTLYIFSLPFEVTESETTAGETIEVGPEQMSWMMIEDSNRRNMTPAMDRRYVGVMGRNIGALHTDDRVGFRFTPLPKIRLEHITELILDLAEFSGGVGMPEVALWDWMAGEWRPVNVGWGENHISNPASFIGPENAVKVMVYNPSDNLIMLKHVKVIMRGEL